MIETVVQVDTNTIFHDLLDTDLEMYRITKCRNILINAYALSMAIKTLTYDFGKNNLISYSAFVESKLQDIYQHIANEFHEYFVDVDYSKDFILNRTEVTNILQECETHYINS